MKHMYYHDVGVIKSNIRKVLAAGAALTVAVTMALGNVTSAATTVTVTGDTAAGNNQPGWLFNRDASTSTPFEFNDDEASIGVGSLFVEPIGATPANKFIAENFLNVPAADVESVAYDFLIAGSGDAGDANQFYLNVYALFGPSADDKFYDCRFDYVPVAGSTAAFTTASFAATDTPVNVRTGSGVTPGSCPTTLAGMPAGSTVRALAINVGDTSASDADLAGYLDKAVVTVAGDATTYDFEPALTPADKDECKKGGWQTFNSPVFKNQGDCVSFVNHL